MIGHALTTHADMTLIDQGSIDHLSDPGRGGANVVIAPLVNGALPAPLSELAASRSIAIIGVEQGGTRTVVELADVSLDGLIAITRAAALAAMNCVAEA